MLGWTQTTRHEKRTHERVPRLARRPGEPRHHVRQRRDARHDRNVGVVVHAIPAAALVVSAGTLGFVASLVIYLMYKDKGEFARRQAANSLNIQITTLIYLVISALLMLVLIGFVLYPLVIVVAVVLHVLGAVRSSNGVWWNPPLTPRFVR